MVSSITYALKGQKLLERNGIFTKIMRTPSEYNSCGCGYSIVLKDKFYDIGYAILKKGGIRIIGEIEVEKL